MINRELKDITEKVLRDLIAEQPLEGKTLEFKQRLQIDNPDGKLKFLRGITSFANAVGGDMILGIAEGPNGEADSLRPLEGFNPDKDTLRLRDIIRMNVDPRTLFADFQPVPLSEGGYALVIRVRKSWSGLHFVTGDGRFYTRDHSGKRPMEVPEIRNAFTLSESISEKINRFRLERLAKIISGETPMPVPPGAFAAIHICPLRSFEPGYQCDLEKLRKSSDDLPPLFSTGWSDAVDFDGFLPIRA